MCVFNFPATHSVHPINDSLWFLYNRFITDLKRSSTDFKIRFSVCFDISWWFEKDFFYILPYFIMLQVGFKMSKLLKLGFTCLNLGM